MSVEKARIYLESVGLGDRLVLHEAESDTVEHAAAVLGCEPAHIAKTMSFLTSDGPIVIVCAGDTKIANSKYKAQFVQKAKMIPFEEVEAVIGHEPGGVCPFGVADGVRIFLDSSLWRFETVYAAGGARNATVRLSPDELAAAVSASRIDVCEIKEPVA
jgi:prolyl-tRNA editing enzyme YbaK/EbsC (Cys-tRNA(Pro) deacylase)